MTTEQISQINILIQKIVFEAKCNLNGKGTLKFEEAIKICKEIVKIYEQNN